MSLEVRRVLRDEVALERFHEDLRDRFLAKVRQLDVRTVDAVEAALHETLSRCLAEANARGDLWVEVSGTIDLAAEV